MCFRISYKTLFRISKIQIVEIKFLFQQLLTQFRLSLSRILQIFFFCVAITVTVNFNENGNMQQNEEEEAALVKEEENEAFT